MTTTRTMDIAIVVFCATMWGLWWYPVRALEGIGLHGPWIGVTMCAVTLPIGLAWMTTRRGSLSSRAILGGILVGAAFMLYAISVSYTDFLRAVLLFYLAPAWSTLIEVAFFGRRWTLQSTIAIGFSLIGVLLISRGDISFDGLGAIGDWMALGSGVCWSVGAALVFSSKNAEVSRVMVVTALGGVGSALLIAWADGSMAAGVPDFPGLVWVFPLIFIMAGAYVGTMMAGTMWGAFRLPPAVMTYLLSIEIISGVLSSVLILGERFGWLEAGGTLFIVSAVLVEVVWTKPVAAKETVS